MRNLKDTDDYLDELAEDIMEFEHDPLGFVEYAFDWDDGTDDFSGDLKGWESSKEWQKEQLINIGKHLSNPETRYTPYREAISSGNGIGKSAQIGMILNWAMSTCIDTKVIVTANTDGQLKSKTQPEIRKWFDLSITNNWFDVTSTKIKSSDNGHGDSWRLDLLAWNKDNPDAFSGLHNAGKRIVIVFDEASGIDTVIWEYIMGALTDENTEILWLVYGNPNRNTGYFREIWRKYSRLWKKQKIDSRTVEGVNLTEVNGWVKTYGEDSDFVRVRVKGEFPNASVNQYIPTSLVDAAQGRHVKAQSYNFAPKILSCDPAWTGDDDIVIGLRQGLVFRILEKIPKNDNDVVIANKLMRYEDEHNADAVFIDGGFGTGIYSVGKTLGRFWRIVWFNAESGRNDCTNKRSEMLVNVKEWLEDGGSFEPDDDLYEELISLETAAEINSGRMAFPPKKLQAKELGRSPNCLDALGLTFAYPVLKKQNRDTKAKEYNPMERT